MKQIIYILWTACAAVFLKYGLDAIFNHRTSYIGSVLVIVSLQVTIVFPLMTALGIMESKINANR